MESIPPIPLTGEAARDYLQDCPGDTMLCYIGDPTDGTPLPIGSESPAGVHNTCSGFLDVIVSTSVRKLLIKCRKCDFKTEEFPDHVNTYGELCRYFAKG